jgi:uncharacterized iron-regulated protein
MSVHRLAAVVALLVSGCATTTTTSTTTTTEPAMAEITRRPPPPTTAPQAAPLQFVDDGAFAWVDGHTGAALTFAEVVARVNAARVVMVGEQHDAAAHHELQRRVVDVMGAAPGLVVGFEMLTWDLQPSLDRFNSGELDAVAFADAVDWKKAWGFPFALYRPIFESARRHQAKCLALNAPRALVRGLRQRGVDGLSVDEKAQLPELDLNDELHRAWFEQVFSSSGHPLKPEELAGFYRAQVLWDEAMASRAAAAVVDGARQVLVIAGAGHVAAGRGVPQRIERRLHTPVLTLVPLSVDSDSAEREVQEALARAEADILVVPRFDADIVL